MHGAQKPPVRGKDKETAMRTRELFNKGWKFFLGEAGPVRKTVQKSACIAGLTSALNGERGRPIKLGPAGEVFKQMIPRPEGADENAGLQMLLGSSITADLKGWTAVNLPHDWKVSLEYSRDPSVFMQGAKQDGVAYYRKTFTLPAEDEGRRITVEFDGVCRAASVWFNGCFLGDHYSGYTSFFFDLSDLANYGDEGDNVLLLRVDSTTGSEGWWYEGAGIYRNVYLLKTGRLHVDTWGTYICAENVEKDSALMRVETTIRNSHYTRKSGKLATRFTGPGGESLREETTAFTLRPLETLTLVQRIPVERPVLWSPESPALYKALSEIAGDEGDEDTYETSFGIRTITYTTEGLILNGKPTPLKGTCNHQDFAGVGTALADGLHEYKVQKLLDMGSNAYRSAHHPADPALLDVCDRLGMMVMDENRLLESTELRLADLVSMIKRDRNHPSVILWSLCNEELLGGSPQAARMLRRLAAEARAQDSTRPIVSAEILHPQGDLNPAYLEIFDILGVNYPESPMMGGNLIKAHRKYPLFNYLNSESASFFSTRGAYADDWERCHCNNFGSRFSMMASKENPSPMNPGGTARPEETLGFYRDNLYSGGVFIWTGFDYRGEPSPFPWPGVLSQFGIMDNCGFPKDYYYYYKANWTQEPLVHMMPHWTWPGKEGQSLKVRVFSNCDEIELILNKQSLGRKKRTGNWNEWEAVYAPGTIEALGYRNGHAAASERFTTAGAPVRLQAAWEYGGPKPNRAGVASVWVTDAAGTPVPNADNSVTFDVEGNGRLLGTGNGDPADHSDEWQPVRRLFAGKAIAVIQAGEDPVPVILKVCSLGLEGTVLEG